MKHLHKLFTVLIITTAFAVSGFTPHALADQNGKDKPEKTEKTEKTEKAKKKRAYPFHGKLGAVDLKASSITLHGKEKSRTFYITEKTKIQKDGKSAKLADAVVGEQVAGSVLPDDNGKLMLNSLRIGPKPAAEKKPAKPKKDKES